MRDIASNIGPVQAVTPRVLTGNNTSSAIDLLGFESAAAVVHTGAIVSGGNFSIRLQESDTTTSGDFADVPANRMVGSFPASLGANSVVKVGYIGTKRYLRTILTRNGGTSIGVGVVIVKGHPSEAPVA